MAHIPYALNLPEVAFGVAQYLELDDFTACSLVNKSFYASFAPYLWENVHLGVLTAYEKSRSYDHEPLARLISPVAEAPIFFRQKRQPSRQGGILQFLQKIAPWIRSLSLYTTFFTYRMTIGDQCTNLHSLSISFPSFMMLNEEEYWNNCEALVRQNETRLRSLTLIEDGQRFGDRDRPIWSPLHTCAQHVNLSTLRMHRGKLYEQDLEAFWVICRQLEILELSEIDMTILSAPSKKVLTEMDKSDHRDKRPRTSQARKSPTHGTISLTDGALPVPTTTTTTTLKPAVRFPKLRELTLDGIKLMPWHQMDEIIVQSPMLHTLIFHPKGYMYSLDTFYHHYAAQTWPYLDSLEITGQHNASTLPHGFLLQSTKRPFKRLDLHLGAMGQYSFDLLREGGHFKALTKVNLTVSCPTQDYLGSLVNWTKVATSKRIRDILESCPSLEHIAATAISGQDIIDSEPWVCHGLKKFEVLIAMAIARQSTSTLRIPYTKDEKRQCHQVFERLSQLRQLKVLNMLCPYLLRDLFGSSAILPLELRMGLGRLSTLTDLEWIGYQGSQRMRMVDMEWMLQHWTKLRKITGDQPTLKRSNTFGNTNVRCHLLMKALIARKVEVPMDWSAFDMDVKEYMKKRGLDAVYDTDGYDEPESE